MLNLARNSPWAILGLFGLAVSASVVFNGASVQVDDRYFFIDPHVAGELPVPPPTTAAALAGGFAGVTVVQKQHHGDGAGDVASLDTLLRGWAELDDVFQASFLEGGVYTVVDVSSAEMLPTSMQLLNTTAQVHALPNNTSAASLPSGPYFLDVRTGQAHRVLRLYDDFTNSFTGSLLQNPDGSVRTLSAQRPTAATLTIGVPSRLYFTRSPARPLAGVRLGVKDLFCVRGARRSNGNRAWYHLYSADGPCSATAPTVQRLVDAGAIIVGYQALAQFANGDLYAADAVDMLLPFNPRGDGYSVPQGSSSGAGAAVAAYPWLDLALGSDTGGSVRMPAQVAGLFGNRPTTGLAGSLEGVTPLSPTLDTPGLLARDPALWDEAQRVLYGSNYTMAEPLVAEGADYPKTIYVLEGGWPRGKRPAVDAMLDAVVAAAVEVTGAKVETLDLEALWRSTRPGEVGDVTLAAYLNTTYATLVATEQWELVGRKFFADYAQKHDGRKPYVNPSADGRWSWAQTLPTSAYPAAKRQQETFSTWFRQHVLAATGDARCSSSLLLYSDYYGVPELRMTLRASGLPIGLPIGPGTVYYAPFSGTPDVALPLGEVRSSSNVTGREEPLPVSADVMAARGCDALLTRLAVELARKGAVKVPRPGGSLDGAEVLFRREMGLL
ncbi:Amidase [Cordyceps fumosorosea ARSEF 2679]|uniref:Amidase n=1 Tax=Cordyceps fumosorosea (strain ARSEF 2679) TaxID=1081104 RepID=A0A167PBP8_CORFA|nr:Amidase [Cordyceps fumosorosea ARSEF 2679]OAA56494.1 Amidase [Cordyceps fumosorosea ARSEF 2679]